MWNRNSWLWSLVVFLGAPFVAAAEDWPQFRGPGGQGVSASIGVPVAWGAANNVGWKTELPGRGWSSPVLAGGRLYLTAAVSNGPVTLHALCVDAANGKILWDVEVIKPEPAATKAMNGKNSLASATPIVDGDKLYVHFGHMGTAALDLSGKILWRQTDVRYSPVHGNGGSPALVDGKLIYNCDGQSAPFVVALDAKTGAVKWKTPRNTTARKTFSFCTPLVVDVKGVKEVISPGSGFVAAYEPAGGHELWRVKYGEGYSVVPRPVFAHGLLFIASGFDSPITFAINPEGAEGDSTASHIAWQSRYHAPNTPSMLVAGDELYFISDRGMATCADAKTGQVHWNHRLAGGFSSSPVLAEGRVYFQNEAGVGYVVKASKEFELLATNDLGEASLASYAVTDGALFIRTDPHLWRIAAK